jgi:hypothetical protein
LSVIILFTTLTNASATILKGPDQKDVSHDTER